MEKNKKIKIVYINSLDKETKEIEFKIRNIMDFKRFDDAEFFELYFWDPVRGHQLHKIYVFKSDLNKWFDKDGNESTDYEKLTATLSVYAEQTKLQDALARLN